MHALAAWPLYHTARLHAFTMSQLLVGACTYLTDPADPSSILQLIETEAITSSFAPPTVWIGLLRPRDFDHRDLKSLKKIYYGASIMPEPVLQEMITRLPGAGLYNVYEQTEIAPVATVLRRTEREERPRSAGRPVLNVQTRVVDPEVRDVAPEVLGEIVHRSPQLLSGYWEKPDETRDAFAGGWFHSGDLGYFDAAGYLYVVDRVKEAINTGGVLVSSREVEETLYAFPGASEVAVAGLPDPQWIEAVTAVVVQRAGTLVDAHELTEFARARIAALKVPKRVVVCGALPKSASGKVLRRELRRGLCTD